MENGGIFCVIIILKNSKLSSQYTHKNIHRYYILKNKNVFPHLLSVLPWAAFNFFRHRHTVCELSKTLFRLVSSLPPSWSLDNFYSFLSSLPLWFLLIRNFFSHHIFCCMLCWISVQPGKRVSNLWWFHAYFNLSRFKWQNFLYHCTLYGLTILSHVYLFFSFSINFSIKLS